MLQITPKLNLPSFTELFDSAKNDKLIEVPVGTLVLIGATAPATFHSVYKTIRDRVFFIDVGAGQQYYEVPIEDFANMTWNLGEHFVRWDGAATVVQKFILALNGNDAVVE